VAIDDLQAIKWDSHQTAAGSCQQTGSRRSLDRIASLRVARDAQVTRTFSAKFIGRLSRLRTTCSAAIHPIIAHSR